VNANVYGSTKRRAHLRTRHLLVLHIQASREGVPATHEGAVGEWKEDRRSGEVEMRSSRLARAKGDERKSREGGIRRRW
jgi:hypothetical protein